MSQCNICKNHVNYCKCATTIGHTNYINKFQDGETVFLKDQGVNVTVDRWSYIPSKRCYSYTTIENPATFYFEHELDFALAPSLDSNTQRSGGRIKLFQSILKV